MNLGQFILKGEALSRRANVLDSHHRYFQIAAPRLHRSCQLFGLFQGNLGDVLEIGAGYAYIPFLLRPNWTSYKVLESNDPALQPLMPLYQQEGIAWSNVDLFEIFGPVRSATHRLPLADAQHDTILCWETMEHFNFNPVKFVRELHRLLKPGGRVCITVPNRVSFQSIYAALFGRQELSTVNSYYEVEDYQTDGVKAFHGFHWHEYAPRELGYLFLKAGFEVRESGTFTVFQDIGSAGLGRQVARSLSRLASALLPRYRTHVYVLATK